LLRKRRKPGPKPEGVTPLDRLLQYAAPYKSRAIAGMLCAFLVSICQAASPIVLERSIDSLSDEVTNSRLLEYGALIVTVASVQAFLMFGQERLLLAISRLMEYDLRNDLYRHLQKLPMEFFQTHPTGDLMARASGDVEAAVSGTGPVLMHSMNSAFVILLIVPVMVAQNWRLTLLACLPLPLMAAATKLFDNMVADWYEEVQAFFGVVYNRVQEAFSGVRTIRAFTQEESERRAFTVLNQQGVERNFRLTRLSALYNASIQFLGGLSYVVVFWYGGILTASGKLTVGQLMEFFLYIGYLAWPIHGLGAAVNTFQRGKASLRRLHEILSTEPAIADPPQRIEGPEIAGAIEFRDLTFTYNDATEPALRGINLRIAPGDTVALVGPVGAGKSTLMNLVPRLLDADSDQVLIDGRPIRQFRLQDLRSVIGYVPQESFLFSQTIGANIAFGAPDSSAEEIECAAIQAGMGPDVAEFRDGYETSVGERGVLLSGGQKQRIGIARAIVRRPKILLLDDALSAVDTDTEQAILRDLREVMRGRTCIISAHRVSTVKNAGRIVVLQDGRIAEQGSHDELLSLGGQYAQLHRMQKLEDELAGG